jgi:UDP-N-acetylmuramoyl-tripeptide--D-alanyl-D-alanine ligase
MVLNACAAAAVGISAGLSLTQIKNGIESVPVTEGRSHIIKTDRFNIIDDCYNANPTSMKAALDLLSGSGGRKAAILGDMFELGADEAELHASVGEYAVRLKTDLLVCIGDLSKNMFKAAEGSDTEAHWYASVDDFIRDASAVLKGADTVLIKASHSMNFGKIVEELK